MPERLLNGKLVVLARVDSSSRLAKRARISPSNRIRIRPMDGGLRNDVTAENLDIKQSPRVRDVFFFKNELRKAHGGSQIGGALDNPVLWCGLFGRLDKVLIPIAVTTKNLYQFLPSTSTWTKVTPVDSLSGTLGRQVSVANFNDVFYFVSQEYELRKWSGSGDHSAVTGGYSARGMDVINNRLILASTIENGVMLSQRIRWTQNGSVVFTGTGSGSRDLADREDYIQNIRKLGPYRGLVYKTNSIVDMRATGDASFPFDTTELVGGLGLLCAYTITEWAGGHFFVASDENIYGFDGSSFNNIGNEIRYELFALLNPNSLDSAIGFYNKPTREYIVGIPTGSASNAPISIYYAYDTTKKRWRSGVYDKLTSLGEYLSSRGLSWDEDIGTWDEATDTWNDEAGGATRISTIAGTSDNKVIELVETAYSFNGSALQFSWESGDTIGQNDGDEVTLLEVIIGYIVDGTSSLTVDASNDAGSSFSSEQTVTLGGASLKDGDTQYVHIPFIITGDSIRVRLRNSVSTEKVRIVSLTLRVSIASSSRSEAVR